MFVHWLCDWTSVCYRLRQGHGDSFLCFRPPVSSLLFITPLSFSLFSEIITAAARLKATSKKKSDSVGKAHWWLTQRVAQNTFKVSGKQKMCDFHQLTTAETGQVCLSVNTGGALSAWKYYSVHSSHTDYTSSFMLTAQQLSVNGSAHGCLPEFFFLFQVSSVSTFFLTHTAGGEHTAGHTEWTNATLTFQSLRAHFDSDNRRAAKILLVLHFHSHKMAISVIIFYSHVTPPPCFILHIKVEQGAFRTVSHSLIANIWHVIF